MIDGQVVVSLHAKFREVLVVLAVDPARRVHGDRLEHAGDRVFVLQAERDHFELQLADGAQDHVVVAQRLEQLRRALLAELGEPLRERLHLERILEHRATEHFRREIRDAREGELLALGEGVADVDGAVVVQADDVAGEGFVRGAAVGGHERERIGDAHLLVEPHVVHAHAARIFARAQPHEGDAVAMLRIHVRLDLEHEAGELSFVRLDRPLQAVARQRRRRVTAKCASNSSTPKLEIAEPKNTGDCLPSRYASTSNSAAPPRTRSISSSKCFARSPRNSRPSALCNPSITRFVPRSPRPAAS